MSFIVIQLLPKLFLIFLSICILDISGEYFTKSLTLNKKEYSILGSTLSVDGTQLEYFARIPYAKPPVGDLRFKHPQPFEGDPWTGIYNATVQPNTCWQAEGAEFDKLNPAAKIWLSKTPMNEDCLYLTIWAPRSSAEKQPVMFWIYGGAYSSGSSTLEVYDGSTLAAKHRVVVVSMQYRIGPLGFLYLDDKEAPGNQGLLDQWLALKWVKDNIHNFGGDSDSITLFGESAGSASVSLHILSPMSQGLVKRAIMESASSLSSWGIETKKESKEKSIALGTYVECNTFSTQVQQLIKCLRSVHPEKLVTKQYDLKYMIAKQRSELLTKRGVKDLYTDASYILDIFFRPIYDNYFIPKPLDQLINNTNANNNIELLMGYTANEGMYFLIYGLNKWLKFFKNATISDTKMLSSNNPNHTKASTFLLENLASNDFAYSNLLPLLLHEYNIPSTILGWKRWNSTQVLTALDQIFGDQNFVCPVIDFAEQMSKNNRKIYLYSFEHRTDRMTFPKWSGAMHGYEIEYVFGMPFSEKFTKSFYSFSPTERKLSEYVMKTWSNFAKYGNPTVEKIEYFNNLVSWPTYNSTDRLTFFFSCPDESPLGPVRINDKTRKCKFWNTVLPSLKLMFNSGESLALFNRLKWFNILIVLQTMWISAKIL